MEILKEGSYLIFVDEATFTPKATDTRVWQFPHQQIPHSTTNWDTSCIACIGAVDVIFGKVLLTQVYMAATQQTFIEFLRQLKVIMDYKAKPRGKKWYVFVDNARIHSGNMTQSFVRENGINLIFNAPYRPEFNGIEGFWSQMKKEYRQTINGLKTRRE